MTYEIIAALIFVSLGLSFAAKLKTINLICVLGVVAFPVVMTVLGQTTAQMIPHLIAGAAVFGLGYILFVTGSIDGGVTKAAALAALWLPTQALADVAIAVGLCIGALALLASARKKNKVEGAALVLCALTAGIFLAASPYGPQRYQTQYALMPSVTEVTNMASGEDVPLLRLRGQEGSSHNPNK